MIHSSRKSNEIEAKNIVKIPEFERLNYFYGQMLNAADFRIEQDFFRDKLKLHNRCFHGHGVVCGLRVDSGPIGEDCLTEADKKCEEIESKINECEEKLRELDKNAENTDKGECESKKRELEVQLEELKCRWKELLCNERKEKMLTAPVIVQCGLAVDCEGNELIVRNPIAVDLWKELSPEDRRKFEEGVAKHIYLSLCFCSFPTHRMRAVLPDMCDVATDCNYGRSRDSVKVKVTIDKPAEDLRCNPCCEPCEEPCVLLARVKLTPPFNSESIDNSVKRSMPLFTYKPTVITGISWVHGGEYTSEEIKQILGTDDEDSGLEVRFSKDILTESLVKGLVDLWVIEGGGGRSANIYHMAGDFVPFNDQRKTSTYFKYRQISKESLQSGDRLLIKIRTSFILDNCCQPVDGIHVGGKVPKLADYPNPQNYIESEESDLKCQTPPSGYGPWTSGNGIPGGDFESWIFIK